MRQEYDKATLQTVLDYYLGLGSIRDFFLFTSGFENSNYYIQTETGKYVIKIFEGMDVQHETILFEVAVMDALWRAGIKTPRVYRNTNGNHTVELGKKIAIVMEYIDGENMDQKKVSDALVYAVGEETGKIDAALALYKDNGLTRQNYAFDLKNFLSLEKKIQYIPQAFDRTPIERIFFDFRVMQSAFDQLPKGLIHNDIGLHNILAKNDTLMAIIDFSDIAFSPYLQSIVVPMAQCIFTYNWNAEQARIFIKGYREHHVISDDALALLYDATRARFATIIVEFSYWNIAYGADPDRLDCIRDYYDFLQKFEHIGKEKFNALIFA